MQPPTPPRESLGQLALPVSLPPSAATSASERIEERPDSALARGSYAWPAWAVIAIAILGAVGGFSWWLRLLRRPTRASVATRGPSVSKSVAS